MHWQMHTAIRTVTRTHSAGQVGSAVGEMPFHHDLRRAEARLQDIGFQSVNEKGNRKKESGRQKEKENLCVWVVQE